MKLSQKCDAAAKMNETGTCIRTVAYNLQEAGVPFYPALVRPHMEYCAQFWAPLFKNDAAKLEDFGSEEGNEDDKSGEQAL